MGGVVMNMREYHHEEIRTPNDNLLVCTVVTIDGRRYAEIKRGKKIDHIELNEFINALRSFDKIIIR